MFYLLYALTTSILWNIFTLNSIYWGQAVVTFLNFYECKGHISRINWSSDIIRGVKSVISTILCCQSTLQQPLTSWWCHWTCVPVKSSPRTQAGQVPQLLLTKPWSLTAQGEKEFALKHLFLLFHLGKTW